MTRREQRLKNTKNTVKQTLQKKCADLPRNTPFKRKELPQLSDSNLASGTKYGFLEKPRYGYYIITTKLDEQEES